MSHAFKILWYSALKNKGQVCLFDFILYINNFFSHLERLPGLNQFKQRIKCLAQVNCTVLEPETC